MRLLLLVVAVLLVGCVAQPAPVATPRRTQTPTPTPLPTDTPAPTASPTDTAKPTPTRPTPTGLPTFTPVPPSRTPLPTVTPGSSFFRADKTQLAAGECTLLRWDVDHVKSVFVNLGKRDLLVSGHAATMVCPDASFQYRLRAVGKNGVTQHYTLRVTVDACGPTAVISRFDASASDIKPGERVTFSWDVACAQAVFFKEGGRQRQPVGGHDSREMQPNTTTTYRLIAVAGDGSQVKEDITIQVSP